MRWTMFRTKLLFVGVVFLILVMMIGALALWVAKESRYHLERSELANAVHGDYLRLSAQTQALFKQLIDVMLTGDLTDHMETRSLRSDIVATLDTIHQEIASEVAFVNENEETGEKSEPFLLARIDRQLNTVLANFEKVRSLNLPGRFTETEMEMIQTLERSIDSDFKALIDEALLRERQEVEAIGLAADAMVRWLILAVEITVPIGLLIGGAALFLIWRRLHTPLDDLMRGTQALANGELVYRLPVHGTDEFAHIATSFNQMARELGSNRQRLEKTRDRLKQRVKKTTRELQEANAALRQTDATRRRFFADISHELRTPITVIQGESQVALRGAEKPPQDYREALQRVLEQAQLLGRLVDDLLFIARNDAGAAHLRREALALTSLVRQVCGDAQVLGKHRNIGIALHISTKNAVVKGDPARLRQLFMTLLENAVQYSHSGSHVNVAVLRTLNGVVVRVTDTGIGIAPEEIGRIFERFYRGHNAAAMHAGGSGLGLPMAKAIVEAHGGAIAAESSLGEGATISVSLPVTGKLQAVA